MKSRMNYNIMTIRDMIEKEHIYDVKVMADDLGVTKDYVKRLIRVDIQGEDLVRVDNYEGAMKTGLGKKIKKAVEEDNIHNPHEIAKLCNVSFEQVMILSDVLGGNIQKWLDGWVTIDKLLA